MKKFRNTMIHTHILYTDTLYMKSTCIYIHIYVCIDKLKKNTHTLNTPTHTYYIFNK